MRNGVLSNKLMISLTVAVLPSMLLAASLMLSLAPITAFAEKDKSHDTQQNIDSSGQKSARQGEAGDGSVVVDPTTQNSLQTGVNVAVNPHVVTDKKSCEKANDHVTQENLQASDQQANNNVKSGEGSVVVNPIYQKSDHIEQNIAVGRDVIVPWPSLSP